MAATDTRQRSSGGLDAFFRITERGSTVRTEVIAGVATWLTMAYILFLNPAILGTVPDRDGVQLAFPDVLTVTALAAGVMSIAMGVVGRYPFAIAAGLGLNAFVTFTLVATLGLSWPEAMGVIVIEGLIISVLVLTGFRTAVMNAIPMDLKRAIGIGIGLFIAFIGLNNAGIINSGTEGTPVGLATDLTTLPILTFVVGFVITAALVARKVRGALLLGIVVTTIFAIVLNYLWGNEAIWADLPGVGLWPSDIIASPSFDLVGNFSLGGVFDQLAFFTAIAVILSVMLSDFFDTMGTVIGVGGEANLLDERGQLPGVNRVLFVDSIGAVVGGMTSSSSNTTYIESAAGVSEGGRTGLASVVTGVLFLLAIFLSPIAGVIPPEATAPVLVIVGYFMMTLVRDIEWGDPGIGIPALLTITMMPFTYSITNGVGAGFIAYVVLQVARGRAAQVHWLLYLVSGVFIWYFVRGLLA